MMNTQPPAVATRPIYMKDADVLAVLAGRKTQLRLPVKPQPEWRGNGWTAPGTGDLLWADGTVLPHGPRACPVASAGRQLWVKECWASCGHGRGFGVRLRYRADGSERILDPAPDKDDRFRNDHEMRWRPAVHMPRWASRLTLKVTDIRVERLRSISEEDMRSEGITLDPRPVTINGTPGTYYPMTYAYEFSAAWIKTHGVDSWDANPWVWAVSFEKL